MGIQSRQIVISTQTRYNSPAVTPKDAEPVIPVQTGIHPKNESSASILEENGKLIMPVAKSAPITLEQLLELITDDNLHREVETGLATGKEEW
jgi:hypothetical protein